MPLSRRDFLEVSALSATGLVLGSLAAPQDAWGEANQKKDILGTGRSNPQSPVRLDFSFDHGWQFFRPPQDAVAAVRQAALENAASFPPDAEWEAATLPHSVRLEPRDVSGCRNYQGVCW
jgi:hypothetical protein